MQLVTPGLGLVFWMLLSFGLLLLILKVFAWKPILGALDERERTIEESLNSARLAKEEMAKLKDDNAKILAEAKAERDKLLKEARDIKEQIIGEAREEAKIEAGKMMELAKTDIENQKAKAITEIRQQIVGISVEIAEKILRREFADANKQKTYAEQVLGEVNFN